jgi:hypothetical protein
MDQKGGCIFEKLLFINVFDSQYVQIHLDISKVTDSTIECRLLSSEGINNHKLLHFAETISKVTKSRIELG